MKFLQNLIIFGILIPRVFKQDQGDQGRSHGFDFDLDFYFEDIFKFCDISVLLKSQFW